MKYVKLKYAEIQKCIIQNIYYFIKFTVATQGVDSGSCIELNAKLKQLQT